MGGFKNVVRFIVLLGMVGIFAGEAAAQAVSLPKRHVIFLEGFAFSPKHLTVSSGDTIVWINQDLVPHVVRIGENQWQSPVLEEGQAWEMLVEQAGSFSYFCMFHPQMTGAFVTQ
ncbi:MAG: cupredoxin domain-containing protein [Nitrospira sp.]|nr:cupredoxin domain-containing protein [Nitrospira sp.]